MFTPEMMEAAQKMMANMSPETMAQMAGMASKMDPNMLRSMAGNNAGMPMPTPAQFEEAKEKMKNMSSDEMKGMFETAKQRMAGQSSYMLSGATLLKNEGNDQVRSGNYAGAVETFNKALVNLTELPTSSSDPSVVELSRSIRLNLALCYLKLEQPAQVIFECDTVLTSDPKSVKAFYRRGLAKRALSEYFEAAKDLKASYLCSNQLDETVHTELDQTLRHVTSESELEYIENLSLNDLVDSANVDNGSVTEQSTSSIEQMSSSSLPNISKAKEIIEQNPEVVDRMGDVLSGMNDEQLTGLLEMTGAPTGNVGDMKKIFQNKEFMKSMTEMMKNMGMSSLSGMVPPNKGVSSRGTDGTSVSSSVVKDLNTSQGTDNMSTLLNDPAMVKNMETMMESMPDSVLEELINSQLPEGSKLPKYLNGSRMKWMAKRAMGVMRFWMQLKRAMAIMLSRNGKIAIASLVVAMTVYYQYSALLGVANDDERKNHPDNSNEL